ncbi:MAG: hypothetical protein ACI4MN_02600 [Candidatus Coproplasma sp.]
MIRRTRRTSISLSKSVSKVTLIGGSKPYSRLCLGFSETEDGLKLCPAPDATPYGAMTSDGLYSVYRHSSAGLTMFLYTNGEAYLFTDDSEKQLFFHLPAGKPFSVESHSNIGSVWVAVGCGDKMAVYDCDEEESFTVNLPSALYGGIVHCGRLFAVDNKEKYKVVWSGLEINQWQEGIDGSGYIYLDGSLGDIQQLENFKDDVLCVRDYGLTVIKALADSRNFRIAPSQCRLRMGEKIISGGVCGQKYYFTANSGLYSFDGEDIKSEYGLSGSLTKVDRVHILGDGYVYADCTYNGDKCIMRFYPESGKAVFFAKGCSFPLISKGEMFCEKDGRFYSLSAQNTEDGRIWRSEPIGDCGRKTLKRLYVDSDGIPEITVVCDKLSRKISGTGRIPVNLSGGNIYVEISGNAPVKSVVAELEVRR